MGRRHLERLLLADFLAQHQDVRIAYLKFCYRYSCRRFSSTINDKQTFLNIVMKTVLRINVFKKFVSLNLKKLNENSISLMLFRTAFAIHIALKFKFA